MKLENEFTVNVPVERAWEALMDLEKVTPCLPGAALTEQLGDEYKGVMTVKMGPVSQKYNGTVHYQEADEVNRKAVLQADGKDARGQGTASATITSTLHDEGGSTRVKVETDMHITGKAAQFGRGMQQEVATKIFDQFADCLGREIMGENVREEATEEPAAAAANGSSSAGDEEQPQRRVINQEPDPEPLDLGEASRDAVVKRVVPLAVGAVVLAVVIWLWRR